MSTELVPDFLSRDSRTTIYPLTSDVHQRQVPGETADKRSRRRSTPCLFAFLLEVPEPALRFDAPGDLPRCFSTSAYFAPLDLAEYALGVPHRGDLASARTT